SSQHDQSATFHVSVSAVSPGAGLPTGSVQLSVAAPAGNYNWSSGSSTVTTTVQLVNGQADITATGINVGSHDVTATYLGDASFLTSTSNTLTQTVTDSPATAPSAYYTDQHYQTLVVDAAHGLLANALDAENDSLSAVLVSGPAH